MTIVCSTVVLSKSPSDAIADNFKDEDLVERPMRLSEGVTNKDHCRLTVIHVYKNGKLENAVFYSIIRGNKTASRDVTSECLKDAGWIDILGAEAKKRSTKYPYIVSGYTCQLCKGEPYNTAHYLLKFILNPLRPKDGDTIDLINLVPHEGHLESVIPEYIESLLRFKWTFNDYFALNVYQDVECISPSVVNPNCENMSYLKHFAASTISTIKSHMGSSISRRLQAKLDDYVADPNETW